MDRFSLSGLLVVLNLIVLIAGIIGGYIVLRSTLSKDTQSLQDRVRDALKDENGLLQDRLERVEEDNRLLKQQLTLIIEILRRQGIIIEINGELVQIKSAQGSTLSSAIPPEVIKKRPARKTPPTT